MTIIWIMLCIFVGYCADKKGRSGWAWGIASIFLTPVLVGITLELMSDENNRVGKASSQSSGEDWKDDGHEEKRCPECGYLVDSGEQYCPRCGEMLW